MEVAGIRPTQGIVLFPTQFMNIAKKVVDKGTEEVEMGQLVNLLKVNGLLRVSCVLKWYVCLVVLCLVCVLCVYCVFNMLIVYCVFCVICVHCVFY